MRRFIQTNPFSNYTPSVSSTPTYGESAMTAAPTNNTAQFSSDQLMGILQMLQNQRNQASQQAPTQQRNVQPDAYRRTPIYFFRSGNSPQMMRSPTQGALSYASNVAPSRFAMPRISYAEGSQEPTITYSLNGQPMNVDQYNAMQRQKVIDMAQKKGREVREPTRPGEYNLSLFGPMVLPTPLTEAQFKARGQYAASRRGTPEQEAFNRKVSMLINKGVAIGYDNYSTGDGKVYNSQTGRQVTGYGNVGDYAAPQFFLGNAVDPKRRPNANAAARQQNNLNQAFVMTGENNDTPMFKFGDSLMDVNQYNDWKYRNAAAAAERQGRELLPRDPNKGPLSMTANLFGPMYEPKKLTPEQFRAKVEYANRPGRSSKTRLFPGTTSVGSLAYYEPASAQNGRTFGQSKRGGASLFGRR